MDNACHRDTGARSQSPAQRPTSTAARDRTRSAELYRRLHSAGQQHGPAFQGIEGLTVYDGGIAAAPQCGCRHRPNKVPAVPPSPGHGRHRPAGARCEQGGHRSGGPRKRRARGDAAGPVGRHPRLRECDRGRHRASARSPLHRGRTDSSAMCCSPEPTARCYWKSTKSKWRCSKHLGRPQGAHQLPVCPGLGAGGARQARHRVEALLLVGDPATADPLLTTLRSGLTERTHTAR